MDGNSKTRVKKACQTCRKKKIRCDGLLPCSTCFSMRKECYYDSANGIKKPTQNSKKAKMYRELDAILNSFNRLKSTSPLNTETMSAGLSQMEAKLEDYRKQLDLIPDLQSATTQEGNESMEKKLLGKEDVKFSRFSGNGLNRYFGLYNPSCLESNGAFGWVLKKLDLKRDDSKTTVFFLLKELDLLVNYFTRLFPLQHSPSDWLSSKFKQPNVGIPFVIEILLKDLPFIDIDLSARPLDLVVALVTKMREFNSNCPKTLTNFKSRLAQEELILAIGYASFMMFTFSEMHDISVISGILSYLDATHWQMGMSSISRFVAVAVRRCLDLGLNRWEYYLDLDEDQADAHRRVWWRCFWWDRWYSLYNSKPFLIDGDCVQCLFPRSITQLGARESMSSRELLRIFQPDQEDTFVYLILSTIITEVFDGIAYNRKFTTHLQDSDKHAKELMETYRAIVESFDILRRKFNPFKRDRMNYDNLSLCFMFNYIQIACLSVIEHILWRLKRRPDFMMIEKNISNCREMLLHLVPIDAPNLIYLFEKPISVYLVITAFNLLERGTSINDLAILCRVARLFGTVEEEIEEPSFYFQLIKALSYRSYIVVRLCIQSHLGNSTASKEKLIEKIKENDTGASEMCAKILDKDLGLFEQLIEGADMSNFHLSLLQLYKEEIGPNFSEDVQKIIERDYKERVHQFNLFRGVQEMPMSNFDELDAFLKRHLELENPEKFG